MGSANGLLAAELSQGKTLLINLHGIVQWNWH
jgi:hypothetical protein